MIEETRASLEHMPPSLSFEDALSASLGGLPVETILQRTRAVACELLAARGYTSVLLAGPGRIEGRQSERGRPDMVVIFLSEVKASVKIVTDLVNDDLDESKHYVLVSVNGATTTKNQFAHSNVSHMTYRFLSTNITKHVFVPEHQYVPPDEAAVLLSAFRATPAQLPCLLLTDPVAVFCGFEKGDLVRIKRKSFGGVTGASDYFRIVV